MGEGTYYLLDEDPIVSVFETINMRRTTSTQKTSRFGFMNKESWDALRAGDTVAIFENGQLIHAVIYIGTPYGNPAGLEWSVGDEWHGSSWAQRLWTEMGDSGLYQGLCDMDVIIKLSQR